MTQEPHRFESSIFDPWIAAPGFTYGRLEQIVARMPPRQGRPAVQQFDQRLAERVRHIQHQFTGVWLKYAGLVAVMVVLLDLLGHLHRAWLTENVIAWPGLLMAATAVGLRWRQRKMLRPFLVMRIACARWLSSH